MTFTFIYSNYKVLSTDYCGVFKHSLLMAVLCSLYCRPYKEYVRGHAVYLSDSSEIFSLSKIFQRFYCRINGGKSVKPRVVDYSGCQ